MTQSVDFDAPTEVVHACPPDGSGGLMPCCRRTPFEVPRSDRMATDLALVTCWTGSDPRIVPPTEGVTDA